jgi:stearoyl-CoA desaturase (delta-9 desaturase)
VASTPSYLLLCLLTLVGGYLVNILYITVFYHRGLTHRAVTLSPATRRFVIATGSWVTGLDPKGWSVMHRLHHYHSDTPQDPHSPQHYGVLGVMLAQLKAYQGVLRGLKRQDPTLTRIARDLDFPVSWLNRHRLWILPYLLHMAIALGIGFGLHAWLLGLCYYVGIMSHPVQGWMVNALAHSFGYRNFATSDHSRNNTLVALLVMGEGYQNNHHRYPNAAKFSVRWYEFDAGYALCRCLALVGVVKIAGNSSADLDLGFDAAQTGASGAS